MKIKTFHLLMLLLFLILSQTAIPVKAVVDVDNLSEVSIIEDDYFADSSAYTKSWPQAPDISAEAAVLMDIRTGNLLYEKNKDDHHYPASTTKILTTWLTLRGCPLENSFALSRQAAAMYDADSSTIYAVEAEQFTVEQCVYAMMLPSANEMAFAAAEQTSGNLKKFVELMNQTAKNLGCMHTHFNNASGLPDTRHYTTAYDLALISRAAWQNDTFKKVCSTWEYTIPATNLYEEPRFLTNHHKMLPQGPNAYEGCLGGKTGYTSQAGNTLVTYAQRGDLQLLCVILKSASTYEDTAALLDYGFSNFEALFIPTKDITIFEGKSLPSFSYLPQYQVPLFIRYNDGYCLIPKGVSPEELTSRFSYLPNALGKGRLQNIYYYQDWKVGVSNFYGTGELKTLFSGS